MLVKELKKNGLQVELKVNIPAKDVTEKLNQSLIKISEDVEIEGFRKGKVRLDIVRQRFGQNALNETLDELVQSSTNEIIRDKKLKLAIKPKIDVKNFGEEKGLEYIMSLEVIPQFKTEDLKKVKLTKFVSEVDEDDYKKTLNTFSKVQQNFEKKDGKKVSVGDGVLLNLKPMYENEIVKEPIFTDNKSKLELKKAEEKKENTIKDAAPKLGSKKEKLQKQKK